MCERLAAPASARVICQGGESTCAPLIVAWRIADKVLGCRGGRGRFLSSTGRGSHPHTLADCAHRTYQHARQASVIKHIRILCPLPLNVEKGIWSMACFLNSCQTKQQTARAWALLVYPQSSFLCIPGVSAGCKIAGASVKDGLSSSIPALHVLGALSGGPLRPSYR